MDKKIKLLCNIIPENLGDKYFITIELNYKGDGISFDNTLKGYRIVKQINAGKYSGKDSITDEWDMYSFENGELKEIIHEKWIDKGKDDIINGIIYRQIWEEPMPLEINNMLLEFNNFLWKHKDDLKLDVVCNKVKEVGEILYELSMKLDKTN